MNNRVLYAIGTYGSAPYIDLGLHYFKKYGRDVIVVDDGSKDPKLREVCNKYNVMLFGDCKAREVGEERHALGDVIVFTTLLELAHALNYEYCVKVSRRWICKEDPTPSLLKLAEETDGATFSNTTVWQNFGFRTEFMGMRTEDWYAKIDKLDYLLTKPDAPFVEADIHTIARSIDPSTPKYEAYKQSANLGPDVNGYVHWDWIGTDRAHVPDHIMWYDTHSPEDYARVAREAGLPYTEADFSLTRDQIH